MMRNRTGSFVIAGAGALAIALAVHGETTKVVSSYGPVNQDMTFSQIKADRLAVKAERAKAHAALLAVEIRPEEDSGRCPHVRAGRRSRWVRRPVSPASPGSSSTR